MLHQQIGRASTTAQLVTNTSESSTKVAKC